MKKRIMQKTILTLSIYCTLLLNFSVFNQMLNWNNDIPSTYAYFEKNVTN